MTEAPEKDDIYVVDLLLEMLKRWWKILLVGVIGGIVGVGVAFILPKKYEASGVAVISPPKFRSPLRPSILPVEAYKEMLLSDGILAEILRRMKDSRLKLRDLRDGAEVALVEMGKGNAPALVLKMRLDDPQLAAEAVDVWLDVFRELAVKLTTTQAQLTEKFIRKQFELARRRLQDAEKRLHDFDAKNLTALLENLRQKLMSRLMEKKTALRDARFALIRLNQQMELLDKRLSAHIVDGVWIGVLEVTVPKGEGIVGELRSQVLETKKRYNTAKVAYDTFYNQYDLKGLVNEIATLSETLKRMRTERDSIIAALRGEKAYLETLQSALKDVSDTEKSVLAPESAALWDAVLREKVSTLSKLRLVSEKPSNIYKQILFKVKTTSADIARLQKRLLIINERIDKLTAEHKKKQALLFKLRSKETVLREQFELAREEFLSLWKEFLGLMTRKRDLTVQIEEKKEEVKQLQDEIKSLEEKIDSLSGRIEELKRSRQILQRDIEVVKVAYTMLKNRVEEAQMALAELPEDVRVAVKPVPPDEPVFPKKWLFGLVGGALSLIVAGFVVLLIVAKQLILRGEDRGFARAPLTSETPPSQAPPSIQDNAPPDNKGDTAP